MFQRASWAVWLLGWALSTCATAAEPEWIWSPENGNEPTPGGNCYFRAEFDLKDPQAGRIEITADNKYTFWLNGERIGAGDNWQQLDGFDVKNRLLTGRNVLAVMATNSGGPAGLVARVVVQDAGGKLVEASSSKNWLTCLQAKSANGKSWWSPEYLVDEDWKPALSYGKFGQTEPWGTTPQVVNSPVPLIFERKPRPTGPFQLLDGDRVVFLGDTLIERAQLYGYWETRLTSRYPDRHITFRNLGWSADNVFGDSRAGFGSVADGFEQLKARVFEQRPTVIILGYGGAASASGPQGVEAFTTGLNRLIDVLAETQAELVILSPIQHEDLGRPLPVPTQSNANRELYTQLLQQTAQSRQAHFLDLFHGLGVGTDDKPPVPYTDNGIHLTAYGYWRCASVVERILGEPASAWKVQVAADKLAEQPVAQGAKVSEAFREGSALTWSCLDQVLPPPSQPQSGPAAATWPTGPRTLQITGLAPGKYQLQIDDQNVVQATAAQWQQGVVISQGPEFAQTESLRQTILKKNELFFHRWRPQNETYLFGFRKHEQGNNAREIPMFDPLILELEKQIQQLRQPVQHAYRITRLDQ